MLNSLSTMIANNFFDDNDKYPIQMYFSGSLTLTEEQIERGDFDEDGSFSIMDATAIQIYLSLSN